jgi:hypothetical protein
MIDEFQLVHFFIIIRPSSRSLYYKSVNVCFPTKKFTRRLPQRQVVECVTPSSLIKHIHR